MKLILTQGLPASGKTTWANEFTRNRDDWVNINRDDIRRELYPGEGLLLKPKKEKRVTEVQVERFAEAVSLNKSVIISDTNLNQKYVQQWEDRAKKNGMEFEIKDFTDVPLEECIQRDNARANGVGEAVIRMMYERYLYKSPWKKYIPGKSKPLAVIFDIDGTLSINNSGRGWYDWKEVGKDDPNDKVVEIFNYYEQQGYRMIVMSGRDSVCKSETHNWLLEHTNVGNHLGCELFMRKRGDTRKDDIVKHELFWNNVAENYNVVAVFDDRPQVVRMWREIGLFVFDVNQRDKEF